MHYPEEEAERELLRTVLQCSEDQLGDAEALLARAAAPAWARLLERFDARRGEGAGADAVPGAGGSSFWERLQERWEAVAAWHTWSHIALGGQPATARSSPAPVWDELAPGERETLASDLGGRDRAVLAIRDARLEYASWLRTPDEGLREIELTWQGEVILAHGELKVELAAPLARWRRCGMVGPPEAYRARLELAEGDVVGYRSAALEPFTAQDQARLTAILELDEGGDTPLAGPSRWLPSGLVRVVLESWK